MFFIFGFGHRTMKRFGRLGKGKCPRCNNPTQKEMVKVTTWFTLFFIPIIPYKTQYLLVCPICSNADAVSKEDFNRLDPVLNEEEDKYAGKTATQIAYLKQMEESRRERGDVN